MRARPRERFSSEVVMSPQTVVAFANAAGDNNPSTMTPSLPRPHASAVPRRAGIVLLVKLALLDVGQYFDAPGVTGAPILRRPDRGRQVALGVVVVGDRQPELLEVSGVAHLVGRVTDPLHGREEQSDQEGDDCDHHQQLDPGKGLASVHTWSAACGVAIESRRRKHRVNRGRRPGTPCDSPGRAWRSPSRCSR